MSLRENAKSEFIKNLKAERLTWRIASILLPLIYTVFLITGLSYFAKNDSTSLITGKTVVFTLIGLLLLALSLFNIIYCSKVNAYTASAAYDMRHSVRRSRSSISKAACAVFNPISLLFFCKNKRLVKEKAEIFDSIIASEKETAFSYSPFPTKKKLMQLYFALLINSNLNGYFSGIIHKGDSKKYCVPGLNCYSCPGAAGACPIGSLQGAFKGGKSTIFYVFGILALYGVLFGRMICGWVCPFGFLQDLTYKLKTPKVKKSPVTRILSGLKYVILIFFVFIVPIAYAFRTTPLPTFCKYICPAGTLEGGIGLLSNKVNSSFFEMLGPLFTWKFVLMVSIILSSIFIYRVFCRFLCPLGALYSIFNRFSLFGVKVDESKCINCSLCTNHCKMDVRKVGDRECISCGDCKSVCPVDAIQWKGTKLFDRFKKDEKYKTVRNVTRGISLAVLLLFLFGAIVFFWKENDKPHIPNPDTPGVSITVPEGNTQGTLCYGSDLSIVTKDGESTESVDPQKTGKITVINFWGTWCTPCVGELPYFDRIAAEYKDSVSVIAVHSYMLWESEAEYIKENYPDSNIIFAHDLAPDNENSYYSTLGGTGTYPYTLILDSDGIIRKVIYSSVDYDDLKKEIDAIMEDEDKPDVPEGNTQGTLCYGSDLSIVTKDGESTESVDPQKTGKITVINFWGTWCTPCVGELPYFDRIAAEYKDSVSVIAVHSYMLWESEAEYIKENYPDSNIIFAHDLAPDNENSYYSTLGGTGTYPYTLILDSDGIIRKVIYSSVTYEDLKDEVEKLIG